MSSPQLTVVLSHLGHYRGLDSQALGLALYLWHDSCNGFICQACIPQRWRLYRLQIRTCGLPASSLYIKTEDPFLIPAIPGLHPIWLQ
jgi:hypothetical protein